MSSTLKGNILGTGQLEQLIYDAINFFGCSDGYKGSVDPCEAQRIYSQRLANAISQAVALGVQQYLNNNVKTVNLPTQESSGGLDNPHVHPNLPQFDLTAP
jgi:hypothetical protein